MVIAWGTDDLLVGGGEIVPWGGVISMQITTEMLSIVYMWMGCEAYSGGVTTSWGEDASLLPVINVLCGSLLREYSV